MPTERLLLTGHRKSGTSMLSKLFDFYPDEKVISYPTDVTLLYALYEPLGSASTAIWNQKLTALLTSSLAKFDGKVCGPGQLPFNLQQFISRVVHGGVEEARENRALFIDTLMGYFAENVGVEDVDLFIIKETSQTVYYGEYFSSGWKSIFLARDPRDVFAAIKEGVPGHYSKYGETLNDSLMSVIFRMRTDLQAALNWAGVPEASLHILNFESLVKETEAEMQKAAAFLGIEYYDSLVSPSEAGEPYASNTYGSSEIPDGVVSSKNVANYKSRLSQDEVEVVEFFLGDRLEKFGYVTQLKSSSMNPTDSIARFYREANTRFFFRM